MPKANVESIKYGLTSKLYLLGFMGVTPYQASRILYGRDRSEKKIKERYGMLCKKGVCFSKGKIYYSNADPFLQETDWPEEKMLRNLLESNSFSSFVKTMIRNDKIDWSQKNIDCVFLLRETLSTIIVTYLAFAHSGITMSKEEGKQTFDTVSKSIPGLENMTIDDVREMQNILENVPKNVISRIQRSSLLGNPIKNITEEYVSIIKRHRISPK